VIATALVVILYLQFYSFFSAIGLSPHWGLHRRNLTPERVSFLLTLTILLAVWFRIQWAKLSSNQMHKFAVLVDELSWSESYRELIKLLERNLKELIKISKEKTPLSRLRRFLNPPPMNWFPLMEHLNNQHPVVNVQWRPPLVQYLYDFMAGALRKPAASLSQFLPTYSSEVAEAQRLLHKIMTTRDIAFAIVKADPYLGIKLLDSELGEKDTFLDNYISAQLKYRSSVLYYEIANSDPGFDHRYEIPESHRLLHWLFSDARVAKRMEVYRPVGETIIAELEELRRKPEMDTYNFVSDRAFDETGRWESPILAGIVFFDIMVTSAFHQGITFHMWLYYFTYFAKGVIENCSPNDPAILNDEASQTRYGHFLRQIFFKLRDWAGFASLVPGIPNDRARNLDENDNIPKCGVSALAQCFHYLLGSEKFEPRFKNEMASVVYGLYFDLRYSDRHNYARMLVGLLRPNAFSYVADDADYRDKLAATYRGFDQVPHRLRQREYLDEFEGQLLR